MSTPTMYATKVPVGGMLLDAQFSVVPNDGETPRSAFEANRTTLRAEGKDYVGNVTQEGDLLGWFVFLPPNGDAYLGAPDPVVA